MAAVSPAGHTLPAAVVQPGPAAAPEAIAAAMGSAAAGPAVGGAALLGAAPGSPAPAVHRLDVPAEFIAKLNAAVAEGVADAAEFAKDHTPAERWMVPDWALLRLAFPPKDDTQDLAYLHQVAKTRTPDGIAAAQHWSRNGLTTEWEAQLEQYTKHVGPVQARAARKLLRDALMMVNNVTQVAKSSNGRKRPFVVDPTLELTVDKPGNNPSYPSGHASLAYAAGLVLSHLMPDRRAEFMGMAQQAAWARVYSGVHFPTDVIAGAKLATGVTTYLVRSSMVRPRRGTGGAVNPGVAGGRQELPGAVRLAGTPIPTAANHPPSHAAPVMGQGQPGARVA